MYNYIAHEQFGYYCYETPVSTTRRLSGMPYAQAGVDVYPDGRIDLISYSTLVCTIDKNGWLTCTGTYSATTRRHIGAFMHEYASPATYYTAKKCYIDGMAYNIHTGEVIKLSEYAKMQG